MTLDGRLDAFGASQLDGALKSLIKDDDSSVIIDMEKVPYLSSGGIRVLVAAEKMLRKRDGGVHLCNVASYPMHVLEMAGFDQLFSIHATKEAALKACKATEEVRRSEKDWEHLPGFQKHEAQFTVFEATLEAATLKVLGSLAKVLYARLQEEDIFLRRFSEPNTPLDLALSEVP